MPVSTGTYAETVLPYVLHIPPHRSVRSPSSQSSSNAPPFGIGVGVVEGVGSMVGVDEGTSVACDESYIVMTFIEYGSTLYVKFEDTLFNAEITGGVSGEAYDWAPFAIHE